MLEWIQERVQLAAATDAPAPAKDNTVWWVLGGLAVLTAAAVFWLPKGGVGPVMAANENPSSRGTDLSNDHLFGRDAQSEQDLHKAFVWITRTGAGRRFPGTPIGWYQQHQIAAIEAIQHAATVRGLAPDPRDQTWYFRLRGGEYQVWEYEHGRWVGLGLSPRTVFDTADKVLGGNKETYGPYPTLKRSKTFARIGAQHGKHDRVVVKDGRVVRHYRAGTGESLVHENPKSWHAECQRGERRSSFKSRTEAEAWAEKTCRGLYRVGTGK